MGSKPSTQPAVPSPLWMGGAVILAAAGFVIHNIREFGWAGLADPGTFTLGGLITYAGLFTTWATVPSMRRIITIALLAWAGLHLIGGAIISVLPLNFLPFAPEQTPEHYLSHIIYGVLQLPLIGLCIQSIRAR